MVTRTASRCSSTAARPRRRWLTSRSTGPPREAGLRLITYSRPGYGDSTARPRPEPRMVDDVADSADHPGRARCGPVRHRRLVRRRPAGARLRRPAARALPGRRLDRRHRRRTTARGWTGRPGWPRRTSRSTPRPRPVARPTTAYLEDQFLPVMLADADDLAEAMGGLLPPADKAAMDRGVHRVADRDVPPRRRPADRRRPRRRAGRGAAVGVRRRRDHGADR